LTTFRRYEKLSDANAIVFTDEAKEKEWDDLDPKIKKQVMFHLKETTEEMEIRMALDVICHVINDLAKKIENLEKNKGE